MVEADLQMTHHYPRCPTNACVGEIGKNAAFTIVIELSTFRYCDVLIIDVYHLFAVKFSTSEVEWKLNLPDMR